MIWTKQKYNTVDIFCTCISIPEITDDYPLISIKGFMKISKKFDTNMIMLQLSLRTS